MMSRTGSKQCFGWAQASVALLEPIHETRNRTRTYRDVLADCSIVLALLAGYHGFLFPSIWVFDPTELFRKKVSKPTMYLRNAFDGHLPVVEATFINPALNLNVRFGLEL